MWLQQVVNPQNQGESPNMQTRGRAPIRRHGAPTCASLLSTALISRPGRDQQRAWRQNTRLICPRQVRYLQAPFSSWFHRVGHPTSYLSLPGLWPQTLKSALEPPATGPVSPSFYLTGEKRHDLLWL